VAGIEVVDEAATGRSPAGPIASAAVTDGGVGVVCGSLRAVTANR
jgi:hypothetical protein